MSNHLLCKRIMSVMLVLALVFSIFPMAVYAEENIATVSFSIDGTSYKVDMKFEDDLLYCRADQWAEAADCLWVFNSDQQRLLFFYDGPTILASYDDQVYIADGSNMWVPFFDAATQTGVYFSEVSGFTVCGYRAKPLAVFYKDMDRMFGISKYRTSEMIIELGGVWALISSASRAYAVLSSFSLKGFIDAASGRMEQDVHNAVFMDLLKTDETLLGAVTDLGEALNRPAEIVNLFQKSLDEGGGLPELLQQMGFGESDIREIVWDLSEIAYGDKRLNDFSDLYEANEITHFMDMLQFVDDLMLSVEADVHTIMAIQEVFVNNDNAYMSNAAKRAVGVRVGDETLDKALTAGRYSADMLVNILLDEMIDELDDVCKELTGTTSLKELGAKVFLWVLDESLSLTDTTDAIRYSDVYSLVQLDLVNYYYRHRSDNTPDNALMMHSVALLYLRSCLAAWRMFEYDESLSHPISNATSTLTAEITNLMKYTEEELLQNGTSKDTVQAIIDLVSRYQDISKQERQYTDFLQNHPEYNYYALLDINGDNIFEMLATDWVNGDHTSSYNSVDLFLYENGEISLAYKDLWSKYENLTYDSTNRWIHCGTGGTGTAGDIFVSLDGDLNTHETVIDYYWYDDGTVLVYYNGENITNTECEAYEQLINAWESGTPEDVIFKPIIKSAPDDKVGYCHSYRLGITSCYDLNGDDIGEEVFATINNGVGKLHINGITKELDAWLDNPAGYYTIINIDASENALLVGISDYGASDDEMTYLYAYDGNRIIDIGYFDDILGENEWGYSTAVCNGNGTISANTIMNDLGTWIAKATYAVDDQTITDITDFYRFADFYGYDKGREVTTKCDLPMYDDLSLDAVDTIIPAGTAVIMLGCRRLNENTAWIAFESAVFDNTKWILVNTGYWPRSIVTPDGMIAVSEAFDGVYFAG